jgi:hypothetical protein
MVTSRSNNEGNILRAHALDLYPVFMSGTHFEQSVGELIPQILQVKVLNWQL